MRESSPQDRTRQQERAAEALVPHPHRLELRGSPAAIAWPALCANCGSGSSERIRVRKAFYRRSYSGRQYSGPFNYRIYTVDIPFCPPCAARHRETIPHVSALKRWRTFLFNPAHIATIGFTVLLVKLAPDLLATLADSSGSFVGLGLLGVLVLGLVWTVGILW